MHKYSQYIYSNPQNFYGDLTSKNIKGYSINEFEIMERKRKHRTTGNLSNHTGYNLLNNVFLPAGVYSVEGLKGSNFFPCAMAYFDLYAATEGKKPDIYYNQTETREYKFVTTANFIFAFTFDSSIPIDNIKFKKLNMSFKEAEDSGEFDLW